MIYGKIVKRILDFVCSLLMILLLSPLLLILSILVLVNLGSPIFFRQVRPGKNEKIFRLVKFRSMNNKKDDAGNLLPDKERLTRFGLFLRKSSLDELPELWCILKGDMSFVGPRPLSIKYLPFYTEQEAKRHNVRPGLTGLAQIRGRNDLDWDQRLAYDIEYVENLTFKNDLKILFKTVAKVLKQEDVIVAGTGKVGDLDEIRQVQRPEYTDKDSVK
ncbi:MAG: sugar transferase [Saccharofermentanales bacterium]|jgi:undecaprenyl phosphate N,N'-diacetylbacillosamine 1-phosphate transferase